MGIDRMKTGQSTSGILFVSIVVIIVAITGTLYLAVPAGSSVTASSSSGATPTGSSSESSTVVQSVGNSSLGLALVVSLTPATAPSGASFRLNASVVNTLARSNRVTGLDEYHGVGSNPVCKSGPVVFDVLRGYFTAGNFSLGTPLLLHGVVNYMCVTPADDLSYYVFGPNSDNFTGPSKDMQGSRLAAVSASISQVFSAATLSPMPLSAGVYTVVVADNWGQVLVVHFDVTS